MSTSLALIPLNKNKRLGAYLQGLIEGDGSI